MPAATLGCLGAGASGMLPMVMNLRDIAYQRLANQRLAQGLPPAEVVAHLGAMQAQDYLGALWSVGLRSPGSTEAEIEAALARREIVRTWPMRGTLHLVAAADARWMLELLTPRIIAASALRQKQLELDMKVFARAEKIFTKALRGDTALSRTVMMRLLEEGGISPAGQRGYHILWRLAQERVLCFGPREGKEQTFVLFDEWLPDAPAKSREDSLVELARRYFTSHGPATLADFAWWSGLKTTDARAGLSSIANELTSFSLDAQTYWSGPAVAIEKTGASVFLLPGFDEYLLGYTDRCAALASEYSPRIVPGNNGMFLPTMVKGGSVVGVWKRTIKKQTVAISAETFAPLPATDRKRFAAQANRYGEFIGMAETAFSL